MIRNRQSHRVDLTSILGGCKFFSVKFASTPNFLNLAALPGHVIDRATICKYALVLRFTSKYNQGIYQRQARAFTCLGQRTVSLQYDVLRILTAWSGFFMQSNMIHRLWGIFLWWQGYATYGI